MAFLFVDYSPRGTIGIALNRLNQSCAQGLTFKAKYDFVFTDQIMSGMSGVELARSIKAKYPVQKVVRLTGYGEVLDQLTQEGSLVNFTLSKPIDMSFLRLMLLRLTSQEAA